MKSKLMALILSTALGLAAIGGPGAAAGNQAFDPEGMWLGTLTFQGMDLRLVFHIAKDPEGNLSATLDSPDQGARGIPADAATLEGHRLRVEIKAIGAFYEGSYDPATGMIEGNFHQNITLPLNLQRVEKVPELTRPQTPRPPYPYLEEEVSYENEAAGIKLAGTLTEPRQGGPFPAALLITGSGSQDRDETIFGHKPFKVLADDLTRSGLAVLRVDDRGVGGSTGNAAGTTSEDFAGDVLAGVEYLKGRADIDPRRIGLIGHSEGGLIAPIVAARSPDIAFIVLLAGTGVPGERILLEQGALIARAEGVPEDKIAANRELQEKIFAVVRRDSDPAAAERDLKPLLAEGYRLLSDDEKRVAGGEERWVSEQVKAVNSPWLRFFLTYDPRTALKNVHCPVLALGGSLDLQVPAKENLEAIEEALKGGESRDFSVRELPGLNHLFQRAKTGSVTEYARIEETIAPAALEAVRDWIASVIRLKK
jgi:pimeloyl-ACP methyl ester carboxylesterase